MATALSSMLSIEARTRYDVGDPHGGGVNGDLQNASGGTRWRDGTASGEADRGHLASATLGASATDSYNVLAAGAIVDIYGQTIDLDALKGIVLKCITGSITFEAPASNGLGLFKAASDGLTLAAGQTLGVDFGPAGLDVTTDSKFDIRDSGGAGATYKIWFVGAT